jgi:hypothetical protein
MFALAGCSAAVSPFSNDPEQVQSALDQSNGGMTTAPESPEFADPAVQSLENFVPDFGDTQDMTQSVEVQGARRFRVAVIWGHLPPAHDADNTDVAPSIIDWTGSVSVDSGAIGLKRTLRFDIGDKVLARPNAQEVDFVSHTLPHVDGLYMSVVIPANASPTMHFKTKSLTTDIDLGLLTQQAGAAVRLDDGRNGMFFIGYPEDGCPRGLLFGRWRKVRPALGEFRGVVVGDEGDGIGHIRGIWGHAPKANANVFFGKYIDRQGEFRGLLGGIYGDGKFGGVWGTVDPNAKGVLEGYYSDGYERGDGRGVYLGRWAEKCVK